MKWVFGTLAGLIVLALAIIGVQNPALITIRFLGWQSVVLPLWVIMVAALVGGMVLAELIGLPGRIHRYRATRDLRQQLVVADASINAMQHPTESSPRDQRIG